MLGVICACGILWLLRTTQGSQFLAREVMKHYLQDVMITAGEPVGNLVEGMTFANLELDNMKNLPQGSKLKIQKLFIHFTSFGLDGLAVNIDNARLILPDSDTIVFSGTFEKQQSAINIFSQGFTVGEVMGYQRNLKNLIPLKGEIRSLDVYIKGNYQELKVVGDFVVKEFVYQGCILSQSSCKVDLTLKNFNRDLELFGKMNIENGMVNTQKVLIVLEPGEIRFAGPWAKPRFTLKGNARVEKTKIAINVQGALDALQVDLASQPPLSKEKLMIMLATGKSWKSVEDAMATGTFSTDVTKDFVDYIFFAGQGNRFAQQFGVHDVTVTFDQKTKGVGAKKDLSDKLQVGYAAEQRTTKEQKNVINQKAQGEYQLTDQMSVGVEKEILQEKKDAALDNTPNAAKGNDRIYWKYKTSF